MNLIDYSIFYKRKYLTPDELPKDSYDVFISAFNDSERVKSVFEKVQASSKHWLILPEYQYTPAEYPVTGIIYISPINKTEDEAIFSFIDSLGIDFTKSKICIDITGFVRPHLVYLVRYFIDLPIDKVDFIYTDPVTYVKKENTPFSDEYVEVRQIAGCQGLHNPETSNDFLIIGSGYDNRRISDIAKHKDKTIKVQVFGFPSLQPDMYQENILKAYLAEEASADGRQSLIDPDYTIFAPANDPFITANLLQSFISKENIKQQITNLYLSPMATKAQTLGFALFYVTECLEYPVSMIFPFCNHYSRETTKGISKIWKYTLEFNELRKAQFKKNSCFVI